MDTDILMEQNENVKPKVDASGGQLQNFLTLANAAEDTNALLEVVRSVLEAPGIYVFGEFLALPSVQNLKDGPHAKYYQTLLLFAYGTCKQYSQNPQDYIELTAVMRTKLQHLTLVSTAIKFKNIPYTTLLEELEITNVRQLEDTIIEAIYADIIHGKLFQNRHILEIDYAKGRDVPPGHLGKISKILEDWVNSCETISNCVSEQIRYANSEKAKRLKNKEQMEEQIKYYSRLLKQADVDDTMHVDSLDHAASTSHEARKKSHKIKVPRSSGTIKFSK